MSKLVKAVVGGVASIFGVGGEKAPAPAPAPVVEKPPVMPTPDDEAIRQAKKKSIAAVVGRQGRASTILSDSDTLGV